MGKLTQINNIKKLKLITKWFLNYIFLLKRKKILHKTTGENKNWTTPSIVKLKEWTEWTDWLTELKNQGKYQMKMCAISENERPYDRYISS